MAPQDALQRLSVGLLGQLGAPTAPEVDALRSRLRTVADRTERIDAKLDEILARLDRIESALGSAPPRPPLPKARAPRRKAPES